MRSPLGKIGALSQKINPLVLSQNHHRHALSEPQRTNVSPQVTSGQNVSPVTGREKRGRVKSSKTDEFNVSVENSEHVNGREHRIDIGDESSDLLGQLLVSGKLVPDKKKSSTSLDSQTKKSNTTKAEVNAKLTIKVFVWDTHRLSLGDIIAVSYSDGLRRFTVHSYPLVKRSWVPSSLIKSERRRKDLHFLASTPDDALRWVSAFAELQCFVNCLPHPLKQQGSVDSRDFQPGQPVKCKSPPAMRVILNPRSGRGRSSKVFYGKVEPILKFAGIKPSPSVKLSICVTMNGDVGSSRFVHDSR